MDSIHTIVEDVLHLAANIREGDDLGEGHLSNRDHRIAELLVGLTERLVETTGIAPESLWVPYAVSDLTDLRPWHRGR